MSKKQEFVWPSVQSIKNELNEFIERGVRLEHEKDVLKSDSSELAKDAEEKFGIPPALFKSHVAAAYDEDKFIKNLVKVQEIADNLNISTED